MNEVLEQFKNQLVESWNATDRKLIDDCDAFCEAHENDRFDIGYGYKVTAYTKFTHGMSRHEQEACRYGFGWASEQNEKDAERFVKSLESRITGVTGEIIEVTLHMTENGKGWMVKGVDSSAVVLQIMAGGYNIQRLHVRNVIRKVKQGGMK